jgi:hypothetical protein
VIKAIRSELVIGKVRPGKLIGVEEIATRSAATPLEADGFMCRWIASTLIIYRSLYYYNSGLGVQTPAVRIGADNLLGNGNLVAIPATWIASGWVD